MANDAFTILNPGAGGSAMDESELNYPAPPLLRRRERVVLGGDADPDSLASPIDTVPVGTEYGLPVRQVGKLQVEGVVGGVPIPVDLIIGDTVTTNQGTPNTDPNAWPVRQVGAPPLPVGAATDAGLASIFARQADGSQHTLIDNFPATQPVTGPLTDAQLRAAAVPVSLGAVPLPAGAATEATLALVKAKTDNLDVLLSSRAVTGLTDAQLRASAVPVSGPLTDAQLRATPVPVSGTVTATGPLTDAQLRASAVPVDVSDRVGRLLGVLSAGANIIGKVGLDAANLAGVALDATVAAVRDRLPAALVGGRLDTNNGAWLGSTAPTVGQKTAAASIPVVLASNQPAIPISIGSRVYAGRYGASIARLTGSAAAQNIASIENPAASGKVLYVRRIKVSASATAAAIVNFQIRLGRTTAVPTGGTTQTAQQRATADAAAVGIIRSGPTATAATGNLWAAAGPSFQNNPTVYASEISAWDSQSLEEEDIVLAAGEGLLLFAEANDVDFNLTVSFSWGEV